MAASSERIKWAWWFLVCLCALATLPGMMSGNFLPKSAWAALSAGIGLIFLSRSQSPVRVTALGLAWTAYLVWSLLSLFWAPSPQAGFERWLMFLVPTLAYLLAARTRFWEADAFWLAFSILAGLIALIGIGQYSIPDFFLDSWFQGTAVPRATMGQRNYAGMYFMITLPFQLAAWYRMRGAKSVVPLAAFILSLIFLIVSRTRGAWLGTGAGLAFAVLGGGARKPFGKRRRTLALLLMGLFALGAGFLALRPSSSVREGLGWKNRMETTVESIFSFQQRLEYWKPCLGITPVVQGAGFGNFPVLASPFNPDRTVKTLNWEVHNDYLQAFVDLGSVGLGLFLLFCGLLVRAAWRRRHDGLGLAAGWAVVGLLAMQFTTFTSEVMSALLWMAGVIAILNFPAREKPVFSLRVPPGAVRAGLVLAGVVLLAVAAAAGLAIRGDYALRETLARGGEALDLKELLAAEKDPARAQKLASAWASARGKVSDRMEELRRDYLPLMWYDANMRHIYLHQMTELAFRLESPYQADWLSRLALELHPADRSALGMLAFNALREGRMEEAESLLRRGVETFGTDPYFPFFAENLANLAEALGRSEEAGDLRRRLEEYRVPVPDDPFPLDRSAVAEPLLEFTWKSGSREVRDDFYLWEVGKKEPEYPALSGLRGNRAAPPCHLAPGRVYFWRIVSRGRFGDERGPIWCFRLLPAAADR